MELQEYFWLILPLIAIQLILILVAIIDWYKQGPESRRKYWWWVPIILFFSMVGPIAYFLIGRRSMA